MTRNPVYVVWWTDHYTSVSGARGGVYFDTEAEAYEYLGDEMAALAGNPHLGRIAAYVIPLKHHSAG